MSINGSAKARKDLFSPYCFRGRRHCHCFCRDYGKRRGCKSRSLNFMLSIIYGQGKKTFTQNTFVSSALFIDSIPLPHPPLSYQARTYTIYLQRNPFQLRKNSTLLFRFPESSNLKPPPPQKKAPQKIPSPANLVYNGSATDFD